MVRNAAQSPLLPVIDSATSRTASTLDESPESKHYWPLITSKDDLPGWLRDNDSIIHGHLMPTYLYRRSSRLWQCLQMETVKIWTHSWGAQYSSLSMSLSIRTSQLLEVFDSAWEISLLSVSQLLQLPYASV